jgi:asparagine synthase (glutamine-hydrolysing)
MCGIAGVWNPEAQTARETTVRSMLTQIKHRGPDSTAFFSDNYVTLGANRLAIVGTRQSDQPIITKGGRSLLVCNGEIYNYKQLRRWCEERGHQFVTDGDVEVIAALYEVGGIEQWQCLDGMFAFALYDRKKRLLFLSRDKFGIKPLYYYKDNGFFFSSEITALNSVSSCSVDPVSLWLFSHLRFIPAPHSPFRDVKKIPPGAAVVYDGYSLSEVPLAKSVFRIQQDRSLPLEAAVTTTVCRTEPNAFLLSGGVDSSAVAACRPSGLSAQAWGVGYEGAQDADESPHAKVVSDEVNLEFVRVELTDRDLVETLTQCINCLGEPSYTAVCLSTYALAKAIGNSGIRITISGDGSDELFFGYLRMREVAAENISIDRRIDHYIKRLAWIGEAEHRSIFRDFGQDYSLRDYIFGSEVDGLQLLKKVREFESTVKLPEYHMLRIDRCMMRFGIEARIPFLRRCVTDWAFSQSERNLASPNKIEKCAVRSAVANRLSSDVVMRVKREFTAPVNYWLTGPLRSYVEDLFGDRGLSQRIGVHHPGLNSLYTRYVAGDSSLSAAVWGCVVLLSWAKSLERAA